MADERPIACIDDLIGEQLRAQGIRCPCPIHTPPGTEDPEPPPKTQERKAPVRDRQSEAAGDDTPLELSHEEAEKIYLERLRRK